MKAQAQLEIFEASDHRWHWRLRGNGSTPLAESACSYRHAAQAAKSAKNLIARLVRTGGALPLTQA
jgi:hypothetical protein